MGAFLLLLLLFIPPLISMAKEDKNTISGYEWDDEETFSHRLIHDPTYSTFSCNINHLDD